NIFRVPLPYAVALGFLLNFTNTELPTPAARASEVLAQAAVPGMLVVLGLQLRRAKLKGQLRPIFTASALRLIAGPLLALPLILLMGMEGTTRQVAIVQSAMPTAVISGVLAAEFGADAEFVTATILVSTILSMATLSILLTIII
ncbi:MAG: AEC family transporter, partial [Anaerolineae bacterium]|nr:AEC family transporter [Anaerolineae bacterium]